MACGKVVKESQGLFCASVFHIRCENKVCKSVWCPSYHRAHPYDIFIQTGQWKRQGFNGNRKSVKGSLSQKDPGMSY